MLVFATNNNHKLEEISAILGSKFSIESLKQNNIYDDIPETGNTLQENALQKAKFVHERLNKNCFADDTGLEVFALNNEPGVKSARYAGEPSDMHKNINLLLKNMEQISNRNAQFRTVIALIFNGETFFFEGHIEGHITDKQYGSNGFGYDSIFVPKGYNCTFAELSADIKNSISHRAIATQKLVNFLLTNS